MTIFSSSSLASLLLAGTVLLGGCATDKSKSLALYDLGPLTSVQAGAPAASLPAISVAEVSAPAWLDTQMMYYRLLYANDQQPRPYAGSRWSMPPALLFGQRLKARIAQAGGIALSASDGATNVPLLRIEADEFAQNFETVTQSTARIALRASVFNGRTLLAQKTFIHQLPAPSADAPGGARALALASDAAISDILVWLAGLPVKK